jgi:hypothetical protein
MQDSGRVFTDYSPNCQMNEWIKNKYAQGSSSEYRLFLQHNACKIMDELRQRSTQSCDLNMQGCVCNFSHPPHDTPHKVKFEWRPSPGFLAEKYKHFNGCLPAPSPGNWVNFC